MLNLINCIYKLLKLKELLNKAYDFMKQFVVDGRNLLERFLESIGQMVEKAPADELFRSPLHPYTQALLSAIPEADIHNKTKRIIMTGELTSPINPKPGCRFRSRCRFASEECAQPQMLTEPHQNHFVACCKCEKI